ncbi:stage III sporulation protein AB [Oscillibacter sp.]|uniref:stage III sporulation protein AB n=1 Tax=Oscillibacter sp. TaxID=1945593 RepID=UPI0028997068|nr:stage III sporulation protein AB [Oscillibacter sp.]
MKVLGSLLLLLGFGAIWLGELRRRQRETETLDELIAALEELSAGIRLTRTPLPRLLRQLGRSRRSGDVKAWLTEAAESLERGEPLRPAWENACHRLPVEDDAREIVAGLGYKLSGDEVEICNGISLSTDWLRKRAEERRKEKRDCFRQTTAVCFSAAALLLILLL